jgi:hypothetical protein
LEEGTDGPLVGAALLAEEGAEEGRVHVVHHLLLLPPPPLPQARGSSSGLPFSSPASAGAMKVCVGWRERSAVVGWAVVASCGPEGGFVDLARCGGGEEGLALTQ